MLRWFSLRSRSVMWFDLPSTISERRLVSLIEKQKPGGLREEWMAMIVSSVLEATQQLFQPVLSLFPFVRILPALVSIRTHYALVQGWKALANFAVGRNYGNEKSNTLTKERDRLLKEVGAYKTERERIDETRLQHEEAMKELTQSLGNPKTSMILLEVENRSIMTMNEEFLFCAVQKVLARSQLLKCFSDIAYLCTWNSRST